MKGQFSSSSLRAPSRIIRSSLRGDLKAFIREAKNSMLLLDGTANGQRYLAIMKCVDEDLRVVSTKARLAVPT